MSQTEIKMQDFPVVPKPFWRTNDNPKKLSDVPTKCIASPEAIARLKAELARRGVEV